MPEVLTASCVAAAPCVVRLLHVADGHALREVWIARPLLGVVALSPDAPRAGCVNCARFARPVGSLLVVALDEGRSARVVAIDLEHEREDLAGRGGGSVIAAASLRLSGSLQARRTQQGIRVASPGAGEVTLGPPTSQDRRAVVPACLGTGCPAAAP